MVRPWPMTAARSSMARRMAEASSTGCTSDLNAFAKALLTARSRPRSTLSNSPTRTFSSMVSAPGRESVHRNGDAQTRR